VIRLGFLGTTSRALLAGIALLGVVIAMQWVLPAAPAEPEEAASATDEAVLPEFEQIVLRPAAFADLADMQERPVFLESRRMPEPEAAAPPPPPTPLRLKLIGVAISGSSRVALLRNTANNQLLQLAEGEMHDGWTLDAVGAKQATFSRGPQTTELPMETEDGNRSRR